MVMIMKIIESAGGRWLASLTHWSHEGWAGKHHHHHLNGHGPHHHHHHHHHGHHDVARWTGREDWGRLESLHLHFPTDGSSCARAGWVSSPPSKSSKSSKSSGLCILFLIVLIKIIKHYHRHHQNHYHLSRMISTIDGSKFRFHNFPWKVKPDFSLKSNCQSYHAKPLFRTNHHE